MKNRLASTILVITGMLITALYSQLAAANWYTNQSEGYYKPQQYYNQNFGNFPPTDIDQTLMRDAIKSDTTQATESNTKSDNKTTNAQQALPGPAPDNSRQTYQQPNRSNYPRQNYNQRNYNTAGSGRNYPPGNMRMGNQSGNFSGPWNNRGNGYNTPRNNGGGFTNPMNNSGSGFSFPWGNSSGSGFRPWGSNNGGRR